MTAAKVSDGLKPLLRPLAELTLLPGNPRQGDIGAISQSLERFGQQKPIVVNEAGVILAGNHTFMAARALGWDEVAAVTADLEPTDQNGFALADNRLSDLASYDTEALLEMLDDLSELELVGTGYEPADVLQMVRELSAPLKFPEADASPPDPGSVRTCPRCGFEF